MTSCFVHKVIRDLESIDHLCVNHIRSELSIRVSLSGVYKKMVYLTIVNKYDVAVTLGWQDSNTVSLDSPFRSALVLTLQSSLTCPFAMFLGQTLVTSEIDDIYILKQKRYVRFSW